MHRQSVAQLLVCLLVCLLPSIDGSTAREDYVATCGWGWQERYMQLHADTVAGKRDGKFVVAIPVKAGLADVIHGYISAFLFALLTDRAFLILRVPRLDDNTQRSVEFAYTAPFFDWKAPGLASEVIACMLPPYFDDNTIDCKDSERTAFNNQKSATVKYFRGVNGGFTADFKSRNVHSMILDDYTAPSLQPQASIWQRLYKRFWSAFISTSSSPEPDILLTVSNRGSTFKLLHNPHHRDVLKNTYNFTEQTAFPCIFHFLFQMNDEVCNSDCQRVANRLRRADNDNTVTLAIHVRNPEEGTVASEHFHCADTLISYHQRHGKKVLLVLVTASVELQRAAFRKYGKRLLLPSGKPREAEVVHDRQKQLSPSEAEEMDKQGTLDSARDYYIMSLADIHILSRASGFGVVGAMSKLTTKHVVYRLQLDGGSMRDCSLSPNGDDLSVFANEWSEL